MLWARCRGTRLFNDGVDRVAGHDDKPGSIYLYSVTYLTDYHILSVNPTPRFALCGTGLFNVVAGHDDKPGSIYLYSVTYLTDYHILSVNPTPWFIW